MSTPPLSYRRLSLNVWCCKAEGVEGHGNTQGAAYFSWVLRYAQQQISSQHRA